VFDASFVGLIPTAVEATVQQAGESHVVRLVDDGSDPSDARGDRVWTGTLEGRPAQYLPVSLVAEIDGARREVWSGIPRVGLEPTVALAFEVTVTAEGALVASRRASAAPGRVSHATEAVPFVAASFWATFLLVYGAVALWLRGGASAADGGALRGGSAPPPHAEER
jgi:hypothetical protein